MRKTKQNSRGPTIDMLSNIKYQNGPKASTTIPTTTAAHSSNNKMNSSSIIAT